MFLLSLQQLSVSNATHVTLRNVDFNLNGNISCEVTTESPSFYTATATSVLQVVGEFCLSSRKRKWEILSVVVETTSCNVVFVLRSLCERNVTGRKGNERFLHEEKWMIFQMTRSKNIPSRGKLFFASSRNHLELAWIDLSHFIPVQIP